jgi:hypothetical protein
VQPADRAHLKRVIGLAAIGIAVEACLFMAARLQPVLGGLFRPVYWAVAIVFSVTIGRAVRRRTGRDRRKGERRHSLPEEP